MSAKANIFDVKEYLMLYHKIRNQNIKYKLELNYSKYKT